MQPKICANIGAKAAGKAFFMDRIEQLKQFLAANENDCFVLHALALEYIKLGNDEQAKQLFERVLKHDENYIGSYYHLAKLHERNGATEEAIAVYEKGMERAKAAGDIHALNELRMAFEDLTM